MSDALLSFLTRFHREVVVPDIERIVDAKIAPLRDEMLANFDAVFKRLDRLENQVFARSRSGNGLSQPA